LLCYWNEDMHLKNFSLITKNGKTTHPAYMISKFHHSIKIQKKK
jgi:hypothetical protein